MWRDSSASAHRLREYLARHGLDADYRRSGHIRVASDAEAEQRLVADHALWSRLLPDEELRLLDPDEMALEMPGTRFRCGLLDESSATINPYQLQGELVTRLQDLGGRYVTDCGVRKLTRSKTRHTAVHDLGITTAEHVLVATNGYTDELVPWLRSRVHPVGSYMIATPPLPGDVAQFGGPQRRTVTVAAKLGKCYFRLDASHRLIFGSRLDLTVDLPGPRLLGALRERLGTLFPFSADIPVGHAWGGRLGFTADGLPHVGTRDGRHYAVGCNGRGLPTAIDLGRCGAALVDRFDNQLEDTLTPLPTVTLPVADR